MKNGDDDAGISHAESGAPAQYLETDNIRPPQIKIRQHEDSAGQASVCVCHKIDELPSGAILPSDALR